MDSSMEAKMMYVFTELLGNKNSRDHEDRKSMNEAARRLIIDSLMAGCSEVSASQEEAPLTWLAGLSDQGVISREEALLAVTPELLEEIMLNKDNTDSRKAIDTLLKWSDEYRQTPIRIYGDAPERTNRLSTRPASLPNIESFDGYSLLHGPSSQTSGHIAELCYAYLDAAESGQMNPVPKGKPNSIPILGSCASDTYKTLNRASGLCEHLSRRIIGLLETEYEGLFEFLNGSPLSIALIEQTNAVGIGSLQDMQLEALLRAALRSIRQGGEPRLEILVRNPADVNQFRATRDWIDGVAEQTLCGRLRCIPYRVGVLLTIGMSMTADESQPRNRQHGHSGEHANVNHMPEVNAQQIKQASQAADMARFADTMILEVASIVSANREAKERLYPACANEHRNGAASLTDITEAIRGVKPELPIWLALDEIHPSLDGAAIWGNELTGIICPDEAVPAARIGTARYGILQYSEQHSSDALHKHAQQFLQ